VKKDMRILIGIAAAGLIAGLTTAAQAQTDGWYMGADAGVNVVPDLNVKTTKGTFKSSFDTGYGVLVQAGYGFGPVRVEGELGWRSNDLSKANNLSGGGSLDLFSAMANAYYDIATGTPFTPFIGVGIGGADVSASKLRAAGVTLSNDDDFQFAYQGIAGVSYAVSPDLSIKLDYHYLRTTQASLNEETAFDSHGGKAKLTYASHAVMLGFTYKFGAPVPAPMAAPVPVAAPAPAPAPKPVQAVPIAKSYLVFFDFDKSVITPDAHKIITQAAADAKANHSTTIALTGHTDTVGSEKYNMALSLRRANAVKAELVKLGIPADEISVVGKGKSEPLVPTKDGVREPQNRRVQIVLP
jgi:outer membrane protein OmpA-like peptidoglycan-associated protein